MPTKIELISAIDGVASYLNQISHWYNSPAEPFGHYNEKSESSYIYEFYCYVKFVSELSKAGNRIQFNNFGRKGPSFPKSPANKDSGWAKFEIITGDQIFDICAGVKIKTKIKKYSHAADISIQSNTEIPYPKDVFLIIDVKYKSNSKERLPLTQLQAFRAILKDLKFPKKIPPAIKMNGATFYIPTLVTNGKVNKKNIPYATKHHFIQVGNFVP
jgi:hypothetical protein